MADEPKLVTALEVRLNAFEKQLKEAGVIAEREVKNIEDKFSRANPVFAGSFLGSFLGTVAKDAANQLISFVTTLIGRFKELEKTANLVNIAMQDLFGLQEAARKFGAPVEDVNKSMRDLATLLAQMQRGEQNSLSRLLDANPAALKGINREALTLQQTWDIIADLVQNANKNIEKIDISRAAGQAESLIPLLEKGSAAAGKLQKSAADTAPDLQRLANLAKDFDKAWADAVTNIKAYIVDGLINDAFAELIRVINAIITTIEATKNSSFNIGGILDGPSEGAIENWRKLQRYVERIRDDSTRPATFTERFGGRDLAGSRVGDVPGGGTTTRDPSRPITNVPVTAVADERSRLQASIERTQKRTAALIAENEAIDQGTAAREQAKIAAELLTVAEQDGGKVSEQQRAQIDAVAAAYGRAAAAIEQARAPLETFAREAANVGKQMNQLVASSLQNVTSELANIVTGSKTASEAFGAMARMMANELAKLAIQKAITGPIAQALGGAFAVGGGGGGMFMAASGGTFGAGRWGVVGERGPELIQTHTGGGVSVYPKIPGFAAGGFLPAPTKGSTVQGAQITINAPGADKAGLARVEAAVVQLSRSLEGRAVRAVTDASSRGHTVIKR